MFIFAYLPVLLYFLLEIQRKTPVREQKQHRGSNILIGAVLTWMILIPTLIHFLQQNQVDAFLYLGMGIGISGVWIRSSAMKALGRFYSRNVGVQGEQRIIQDGWYRYIRHPGYLGTFLTYLGFAVSTASWLAIGINIVLFFLAYSYRIRVEEQTLTAGFGDDYRQYQARTWRVIPFLY